MSKAKSNAPKKYTKANLPRKIRRTCGKTMTRRKHREKVWDNVRYRSERCRKNKNGEQQE
ncbi:MAG: DUF2256 domain-containing protein [Acidobacteriota bacterium]|nr:DUF2256 domain-containing protein [Acidobacteriota bacterium]